MTDNKSNSSKEKNSVTDFWEVLGRMAVDLTHCNAVLAFGMQGTRVFPTQVWPVPLPFDVGVLNLSEADYTSLRNLVQAAPSGPVSLMALGEIYRALYFQSFADSMLLMSPLLANKLPSGLSAAALRALGCMIVDSRWRDQVWTAGDLGPFTSGLAASEVGPLLNLSGDAEFGVLADKACREGWDRICPVKFLNYQSANLANHAHFDYRSVVIPVVP